MSRLFPDGGTSNAVSRTLFCQRVAGRWGLGARERTRPATTIDELSHISDAGEFLRLDADRGIFEHLRCGIIQWQSTWPERR